ncbi:MAG: hypothetical protein O3C21_19500, partial [Verrucomicrobia bacterium]|nr:hypothetical protein [Verrucomicrobiota bacterium]
ITHNDGKPSIMPALSKDDPAGLVAALENDNMFWRMHAQRMLVERGNTDAVADLTKLIEDTSVDEIGLNTAAIHALWTLNALGTGNGTGAEAIAGALTHPAAGVRRAAVTASPRQTASTKALLTDKDAQVRLAALLALADSPQSDSTNIGAPLVAMLLDPANAGERWIADAAVAAAAPNAAEFLNAALGQSASSEELVTVISKVTTHYALSSPADSILETLSAVEGAKPDLAVVVLDGLVSGWPENASATLTDENKAALTTLMDGAPRFRQGSTADSHPPLGTGRIVCKTLCGNHERPAAASQRCGTFRRKPSQRSSTMGRLAGFT